MLTLKIPTVAPTEQWHEITAADGITFKICVRGPSVSASLGELGAIARSPDDAFGAQCEHRIRTSVIDWRDVAEPPETEGAQPKPIEYSWEALAALLQAYPQAMRQVTNVVYAAWAPIEDDAEKN